MAVFAPVEVAEDGDERHLKVDAGLTGSAIASSTSVPGWSQPAAANRFQEPAAYPQHVRARHQSLDEQTIVLVEALGERRAVTEKARRIGERVDREIRSRDRLCRNAVGSEPGLTTDL